MYSGDITLLANEIFFLFMGRQTHCRYATFMAIRPTEEKNANDRIKRASRHRAHISIGDIQHFRLEKNKKYPRRKYFPNVFYGRVAM